MKFVELTGESLAQIINDDEIHADDLVTAGVTPQSIIRINEHGDIEIRRPTPSGRACWSFVFYFR